METNLPTPMTARVYVNLPECIWSSFPSANFWHCWFNLLNLLGIWYPVYLHLAFIVVSMILRPWPKGRFCVCFVLEACRDHWRETDLFYLVFIAVPAIPSQSFGKQPSPFLEAHSCRYFFSRDAAIPEKGRSKTISRIFHGFFCCFCKIGKGDGFEMFWEGRNSLVFFGPVLTPHLFSCPGCHWRMMFATRASPQIVWKPMGPLAAVMASLIRGQRYTMQRSTGDPLVLLYEWTLSALCFVSVVSLGVNIG